MPNAAASISRAVEVAHRAGTLVVLTAGDVGLVQRKRPQLLEALRQGADILFTNRCALRCPPPAAAARGLLLLASCCSLTVQDSCCHPIVPSCSAASRSRFASGIYAL